MNPKMVLDISDAQVVQMAFDLGRRARIKAHNQEVHMDLLVRALGQPEPARNPLRVSQDPAGALDEIAGGISGKL